MNDYDQLQQLRNQQLSRTIQYTGELARLERVTEQQAETIIRLSAENERLKAFESAFAILREIYKWTPSAIPTHVTIDGVEVRTMPLLEAARNALNSTAKPDTLTPEQIEANKQRRGERMTAIQAEVKANAAAQPRGYPKRVRMLQSHIWGNMPNGKSFKVSVGDQLITAPPPFSVDPDKTTDVWIDIHGERRMLPAGTWERVDSTTDANPTFGK